jgi:hypothetical protein
MISLPRVRSIYKLCALPVSGASAIWWTGETRVKLLVAEVFSRSRAVTVKPEKFSPTAADQGSHGLFHGRVPGGRGSKNDGNGTCQVFK